MANHKNNKQPPRWVDRFLEWFLPEHLLEDVQGDLHEVFYKQIKEVGLKEARSAYLFAAIRYIRPYFFKRRKKFYHPAKPLHTDMLQHYLLIAMRNIGRQKTFSLINIVGLALGMTCSLLIFLWVQDEQHVDNFHANGQRLYRVYTRSFVDGQVNAEYNTPGPLPAELKRLVPEITHATGFVKYFRLSLQGDIYETFEAGDKIHKMKGGRAGVDFFRMFSYPLLQGDAGTALDQPTSLAISRRMAGLFFGSPEEAMGKTLRFDGRKDLMVTAVFENPPAYSTDQFDYLANWDAWVAENPFKQAWGHFGTLTYVQLRPDANPAEVEAKIQKLLMNFLSDMPANVHFELGLQPFGEMYLHSNFENGRPVGGRIAYVKLFSGVAVFILLIACINFMNLSTAHSAKRAKEVGIRKVVGAAKSALIKQFTGEAILMAFLALMVCLLLTAMMLPAFNQLTGKEMQLPITEPLFMLALTGMFIITGIIAGSYPAFFLSSFRSVSILKGTLRFGSGSVWMRKSLVVFQFVLSILLLIATLVVTTQTNYIQNTHLGYDRENIIYIPLEGELINKYLTFKEEASKMPGIKLVDRSSQFPHAMEFIIPAVDWEGKDPDLIVPFAVSSVGYDFVKLMGLSIVQGRDFSREFGTDSTNLIVNEEAVRRMGLTEPVGKPASSFIKKGKIVGVIKDYHFQSLHSTIQPVILDIKEHLEFGTILVRTEKGKTQQALESLEKVCKQINPDYPFNYTFLDEQYGKLYKSEQIISTLSHVFAFIAIVISCLGLLGLAIFSAQQRTKEVGIRKVLGASVSAITLLLSKDFIRLVFIAFVIASPLAWYAMNRWLDNFAYRIELSAWLFILAGVFALLIALLTVSFQAIKAAVANPVKSLRNE